jgi:cardiolipin synthase
MSGGLRREGLDRALARASDAPLREGNRLEILRNGPDTYEDWLAAIARAERWVHLDNYIFKDDEVGERFAEALVSKAEEGVSVRVLYDWFGCLDVRRSFWRRMREAGVEVRVVNPPTLGGPLGTIRRDHRKLLAVDGEYASTIQGHSRRRARPGRGRGGASLRRIVACRRWISPRGGTPRPSEHAAGR